MYTYTENLIYLHKNSDGRRSAKDTSMLGKFLGEILGRLFFISYSLDAVSSPSRLL